MGRLRFLCLYALAWTPFAALYALALAAARELSVRSTVELAFWSVLPAAVLGLGAWHAARVLIRSGAGGARAVGWHVPLAALYAVLWVGIIATQIVLFAPRPALDSYLRYSAVWQLVIGVLLYGVIVGVAHALTAARRVREREAAAARADAARARAELSALRARLDPHFLFNTLHSVGALVRADSAAAESALERFADLLRYVLDAERGGRDDVALHDELAFVRSYLALEQLRLGERLQVVEEVDPDALECAVPPLTLQPLVENAIRHGLAPLARGGTLRVTAGFDGDLLALEVADDGAGADAATTSRAAGLGLSTVRQRLQGRWPEARTDVVTAPGEGFVVRLRLPARAHRPLAVHG